MLAGSDATATASSIVGAEEMEMSSWTSVAGRPQTRSPGPMIRWHLYPARRSTSTRARRRARVK